MIYFIQSGAAGPIKIGHAVNAVERFRNLEAVNAYPLRMLCTVEGDKRLERNLQDCFADCHYHHEWFLPSPRLMAAIVRLKAGVPVAEAIDLNDRRGNTLGVTQKAAMQRDGTSVWASRHRMEAERRRRAEEVAA